MKLVEPPRHTSFYESFSDLVFGTLCVFILIVLALMVKLDTEVKRVVSPSRFQGGTDYTAMYMVAIKQSGEWHLMWVPAEHHENIGISNPVAETTSRMCDEINKHEYLIVRADSASSLAKGIVGEFHYFFNVSIWAYAQAIHQGAGDAAQLQRTLLARQLEQHLVDSQALAGDREAYSFLTNFESWRESQADIIVSSLQGVAPTATPSVRFTSLDLDGERRIRVGEYEMDVPKFRMFLRSIKPGKGFYIEYVDIVGVPAEPPQWVLDDVLKATGYDGRVISDYAKATSVMPAG